ncbi:MAG TPA: hypothetical protein VN441_17630 [Syntrophomonas sp.]|nr:hypothetical protein [Syntrophomonas sp.]
MRKEDIQCRLCPNECLTTMVISEQGLVTEVWRNIPVHNMVEKRSCKQLSKVIGKNMENARKAVQKRAQHPNITIGH